MQTLPVVVAVLSVAGLGLTAANRGSDSVVAETGSVVSQPSGVFEVDTVHSNVQFAVDYFSVARFHGRFNDVSGSYLIDLANLSASELRVVVDAESVDTADAKRDTHLKSPDFFAAREHPEITFVATTFRKGSGEDLVVEGDLTFRGKTQKTSATLTYFGDGPDAWGNNRSGFEARFSIDRSDFGSTYGIDNKALSDKVDLLVGITGIRK